MTILTANASESTFGKEIIAFHPMGGIQYNMYSANFNSFQNMIDCGTFKEGSGVGASAYIFIERPFGERFHPAIGFGLNEKSGDLIINNEFNSRSSNSLSFETVETKNILQTNLNYFEVVPGINYLITDDFYTGSLRFFTGFKLSFVNTKTFEFNEEIQSPENAVFISNNNYTQKRDIAADDIASANSILYGLNLAIENMIKVGKKNYFTQRIGFDYMFNDITQDANWKTYAFRFEVGYRFSIAKQEKKIKSKPAPMPIPPKPVEPVVVKKVEPVKPEINLNINEPESQFKLFTGNEILATVPVVNTIFFNTNSSEIPSEYKMNDDNVDYFKINALDAHKYVLPRIANILKNNPDATVVLESSISDLEKDKGITLSENRANAVKSILEQLGVKNKISIDSRLTPQYPSNQEFQEGKIENQRVMIKLKNAQLQEYVDIQKFAEVNGNLKFDSQVKNVDEPVNIKNNVSEETLAVNNSGQYGFNISERTDDKLLPIIVQYNYKDASGRDTLEVNVEELEKEIIELNLDNFEAILRFNYNSSELSNENKLLLKQLVDKLPDGSTIEILGSADELGTADRNKELEEERAGNTRQFINSNTNKNINIITGVKTNKFDESTPQGRFLNRSITIRVK